MENRTTLTLKGYLVFLPFLKIRNQYNIIMKNLWHSSSLMMKRDA